MTVVTRERPFLQNLLLKLNGRHGLDGIQDLNMRTPLASQQYTVPTQWALAFKGGEDETITIETFRVNDLSLP